MKKADAVESNAGGKKRRRHHTDPNSGRGAAHGTNAPARASGNEPGAGAGEGGPTAPPLAAGRKSVALASNAVSQAMASGKWEAAIAQLAAMRSGGMVPQLGSVQRWVRACDAAEHDPAMLQLLDAILRTCDANSTAARPPASAAGGAESDTAAQKAPAAPGTLHMHPPWCPAALAALPEAQQQGGGAALGNTAAAGAADDGSGVAALTTTEASSTLPTVKYSKEVLLS